MDEEHVAVVQRLAGAVGVALLIHLRYGHYWDDGKRRRGKTVVEPWVKTHVVLVIKMNTSPCFVFESDITRQAPVTLA